MESTLHLFLERSKATLSEMIPQKKLKKIIDDALREKFGDEFGKLHHDQSLQSAGLDSVDILDTIAIIENISGVFFERDELMDIDTLDDLYNLVFEKSISPDKEDLHT